MSGIKHFIRNVLSFLFKSFSCKNSHGKLLISSRDVIIFGKANERSCCKGKQVRSNCRSWIKVVDFTSIFFGVRVCKVFTMGNFGDDIIKWFLTSDWFFSWSSISYWDPFFRNKGSQFNNSSNIRLIKHRECFVSVERFKLSVKIFLIIFCILIVVNSSSVIQVFGLKDNLNSVGTFW